MSAFDIISSVTASVSTTAYFDVSRIDRVTQAVQKAQRPVDADTLLARVLHVSKTDILGFGLIMDAITTWIAKMVATKAVNALDAASYNAIFMAKSLLAPEPEKELYWQVRDADTALRGKKRSYGDIVRRVRKNKLMNWSYSLSVCCRLADRDMRYGAESCVVRCLTPQLCFASNKFETRSRLREFCTAMYNLETAATRNKASWGLVHGVYDRAVTLLGRLQDYANECEALTFGEHDAVCRVVYRASD